MCALSRNGHFLIKITPDFAGKMTEQELRERGRDTNCSKSSIMFAFHIYLDDYLINVLLP